MKIRNALLTATVLMAPLAAVAQPIDGVYVSGGFGANYRQSQDIKGISYGLGPLAGFRSGDPNGSNFTIGKIETDLGFVGVGAVGYGFGNGLRVEIEGNYRQNKVRKVTGSAGPTRSGGDIQAYGGLVNVLYDIDVQALTGEELPIPVLPYVGVGAGYGFTKFQGFKDYTVDGRTSYISSNGQDDNFAYQGIAGLAFPITDVPGLALTAEYRFYGQIEKENIKLANDTPAGRSFGRANIGNSYNHSGLVGIRYAFDQAPPPPPPVAEQPPVAAPARSYLVFFDWDKATLTSRARQIVKEAADNSTHVQYTKIEVNGYTDTSGTPKYNQGLSVRRADAVAAELVRDGVPRNAIAIQGFGETRLLVQTAKGVREPQNRRVEIIIR